MIPVLPATLAPPAPFPLVLAQSREEEFVAPGVVRATYRMTTSDGPLSIAIVAVDPREPSVRIDSVVAGDRLISRGETLSSMARRTGAVAGVNADYFDIGQTNQPLNLVVHAGSLVRTPSKRIVLIVHRDRTVTFERASFAGTASYGATIVPLTTINEWPPQGGAGLLTSAFGSRKNVPGVRVCDLVPADASHLAMQIGGRYRVAAIESDVSQTLDAAAPGVAGVELAFGPAALAIASPPAVGDDITIAATLAPPLDDVRAAVGGGPLLVANGATIDDPISPAPEERDRRFPVSGAGTTASGELVLASVDGRRSDSIGLTRPQFAALWLALGTSDAMAFDSGGSSEVVARVLGDAKSSVLGSPSDGEERAIADGLFVYSDAPVGPPARLVARPREIVALPDVDVPIALAITDAAGHALGAAHAPLGDWVHVGATSGVAELHASGLVTHIRVGVVARPATLAITPDVRDPSPGDVVHFDVFAADATGRRIFIGDRVRWTATGGIFNAASATLRAGGHDASVSATLAGVVAKAHVFVGRHSVALAYFDAGTNADTWQFTTSPISGAGSATVSGGVLRLAYDFTHAERAAYANASFAIPGNPQSFSLDVLGDGSGVGLRAAFVNVLGERRALTLAKSVSWKGWQRVAITLPDDLNPPVRLLSLYAFDGLDGVATHGAGSLAFRNPTAQIAGSP